MHQKKGWTAIGFWDRTGDNRGNSNSNFIVEGTYSFEDMCHLAEQAFPAIWKRIGNVTLHSTNCPDIQGFVIKKELVEDRDVLVRSILRIKLHGYDVDTESAEKAVESIAKILGIQIRRP